MKACKSRVTLEHDIDSQLNCFKWRWTESVSYVLSYLSFPCTISLECCKCIFDRFFQDVFSSLKDCFWVFTDQTKASIKLNDTGATYQMCNMKRLKISMIWISVCFYNLVTHSFFKFHRVKGLIIIGNLEGELQTKISRKR